MIRVANAALFALLLCSAASAQEFADWLPEKTVFYASFDNVARSRARLKKSGFFAMWNDAEMRPLREKIESALDQDRAGQTSAIEFLGLLGGQACIAVIPTGQNSYGALALLDLKGKRREILDFIEKLKERAEGESRETEEDFHGYTIVTHQTLVEGQEEPDSDYYVTKDDLFVIAEDLDALKDVLTRRESGDKTGLGHTESFQRVLAGTGERSDVRFYLSAGFWRRELGAMATALPALGLDGVKGVGGQFSLRDAGISMQMLVHNVGEARGILKLLGGDVEGLAPPKLMPPDVDPAVIWAIDWQLVFREVLRMIGQFDPGQKEQIEAQIAMMEQQLGFKIGDDLLASLAPGTSYGVLPIPRDEKGEFPTEKLQDQEFLAGHIVLLQKLRNKETMQRILSKLATAEFPGFKETQYLGTTIWGGAKDGEFALAIVGHQLVAGTRLESVQTVVRRQGKELESYLDTDVFKAAQAMAPAKRSMLMVSDTRGANGSFFWARFRDGFNTAAPEEVRGLLPSSEFFSKFVGTNVFSLSFEERGLLFNWFFGVERPDDGRHADEEK